MWKVRLVYSNTQQCVVFRVVMTFFFSQLTHCILILELFSLDVVSAKHIGIRYIWQLHSDCPISLASLDPHSIWSDVIFSTLFLVICTLAFAYLPMIRVHSSLRKTRDSCRKEIIHQDQPQNVFWSTSSSRKTTVWQSGGRCSLFAHIQKYHFVADILLS